MTEHTVGAVAETAPGERRVALSPDGAARLRAAGHQVIVETGAGNAAWFTDSDYTEAGARALARDEVYAQADIIVCIHPPAADAVGLLRPGQVLIGLLAPVLNPDLARSLAQAKVTAISLDGLPRTLSAAQSMDVLSSQANVAGYKAALVAADTYGGYLPMFMTAAGTTRPAQVLVIGAGVAGLQAISTTRRLGAVVTGYDVRDAARADVASTGANFLDIAAPVSAAGDGGYARALTEDERDAQQLALAAAIAGFDIVITTAQVPGRAAPVLVSAAALGAMRPGSVVVDLAANEFGGNVEGALPETTMITDNGVTVIGAGNLPSGVPKAASTAYSRNIVALLTHLVGDDGLTLDPTDPITAGVLITHDGNVIHPAVRALVEPPTAEGAGA
ncbi:NAD(P) transhydrogenase subunit alpha [Mycolicibacterium helvum]|uniref:proton-translocating NAD(P)(+) transhydrogenase n=1 Tax=Mycolicibacterium helvum TaxID=1534349 RepID=A0A7I7TBG7_9MYCO|nr:NAD(P) transhydrogenase subunit alpha [Mycolicibacterium helvum]BBY65821.1 NAD(P) transhydrogenase subunit alpha [Mycolicibacterium helvum]